MRSILASALPALAFCGPVFAGPITVDGNVEVGGEAGGAPGAGMLGEGVAGSTYNLNASGFSLSHAASARTVGLIRRDPNWLLDTIAPGTPVQIADDGSGTAVGMADCVYTRDSDPATQHDVIRLSLDRSIFGAAGALDIYWAPSCGNDVLEINDDLPTRVSEPATLAVSGIGLLGFRVGRRRRS